jgi:hypothetical protein
MCTSLFLDLLDMNSWSHNSPLRFVNLENHDEEAKTNNEGEKSENYWMG